MKTLTEQDLLDLKDQIEEARTTVSELKGQKISLLKQLKEDWDCSTVEEGNKKLETIESDIDSLEQKIQKGIAKLQEEYEIE